MGVQFNDGEVLALKIMARELAGYCREDIMGSILYTGAFHALPDDNSESVVALAHKLAMTEEEQEITRRDGRIKKGQRCLHHGTIKTAISDGNLG